MVTPVNFHLLALPQFTRVKWKHKGKEMIFFFHSSHRRLYDVELVHTYLSLRLCRKCEPDQNFRKASMNSYCKFQHHRVLPALIKITKKPQWGGVHPPLSPSNED